MTRKKYDAAYWRANYAKRKRDALIGAICPPDPVVTHDVRWPRRIAGVPWCSECGMDEGHHWPGCPEAPA